MLHPSVPGYKLFQAFLLPALEPTIKDTSESPWSSHLLFNTRHCSVPRYNDMLSDTSPTVMVAYTLEYTLGVLDRERTHNAGQAGLFQPLFPELSCPRIQGLRGSQKTPLLDAGGKRQWTKNVRSKRSYAGRCTVIGTKYTSNSWMRLTRMIAKFIDPGTEPPCR